MHHKLLRLLFPIFCAVLFLGLWSIAVSADGGPSTPLPEDAFAGPCSDWIQVNHGAFGVASNAHVYESGDFFTEDAFEVLVYKDQLYVGMEADDSIGAMIWRTKAGVSVAVTQTDWEEVAQVDGLPFGNANATEEASGLLKLQNDHIDSLASFRNAIYASTANGGSTEQGHLLYRSETGNPGTWEPVIAPGFGYTKNVNFKDMQVFNGWLCGGTYNAETGAQVWCTLDGLTWTQKSYGGLGKTSDNPETMGVWSGHVYSGALYFGTQHAAALSTGYQGVLYRTEDISTAAPLWTPVYTSPLHGYRIDILGDINHALYISYQDTDNGIVILRSPSGDEGTWAPVNITGMDGDKGNMSLVVDGATVYNGMLYCAVKNAVTGTEVWRTDGVNFEGEVQWVQVGPSGLGNRKNLAAELAVWNGYLYAWAGNYFSGQEVRRTSCGICQEKTIHGPGRYDFSAVSVTLTFKEESLNTATVCVKPGWVPANPRSSIVVSRSVEVLSSPANSSFIADIDISYHPMEVDVSAVHSPTLYLRFWAGDAWATSCEGEHSGAMHTFACERLTRFSSWIISGTPGAVMDVKLYRLRADTQMILMGLVPVVVLIVLVGWCRKPSD